ncbi:phosphoribosylformylglycinamidine synthase [Clostridium rectalis]|uniref:phosphoribosylformylglycinamidine synthase n=1 Tax=Clostridium rectalis TaxID=2040295 RepID=UPI000F62C94D|nr:phosphoribosylformylglycinamidine synthase [Clostridium rectalis]
MINSVIRVYVEKKMGFNIEADNLMKDINLTLGIVALKNLRIINRYDIEGITLEEFRNGKNIIFSEPPIDNIYEEVIPIKDGEKIFAVEYLPGQYDQRADSAMQCVQLLTGSNSVIIRTAKVYILEGNIEDKDFKRIKEYCINKVDSREASIDKPQSCKLVTDSVEKVHIIDNFILFNKDDLIKFSNDNGLAMDLNDLLFCQQYFKDEGRNPTITEIKVIDTYWSDHCRHTTFNTIIKDVNFEEENYSIPIKKSYNEYLNIRKNLYKNKGKSKCLMDIATIGAKELKNKGFLNNLDESDEINACSICVDAKVNGKNEEWLVMFKNETHNHPTEIEPFGGAATCLGGAIRDPLSGRSYVYQAMRVTGCGDPRESIARTIKGKLPQRKITLAAAEGYSSYGNQIGLATGNVSEIYHKGYIAKRMEVGAVIGAVKKDNVIREIPKKGDAIILLGGRTGRDGCGGATGSSKEHTETSIVKCSSEVQKGNAPTERKIQRLFRDEEVIRMIKRCNDFGAGGVSVAVGELTDGILIDLDSIPKKYEGINGTELAISESQERMAVVVDKENVDRFIELSKRENLEATKIAEVTSDETLKMFWQGELIVDIKREFLNCNGVSKYQNVYVKAPIIDGNYFNNYGHSYKSFSEAWVNTLKNLNVCSKKGLVERFDSTIGSGTVLMPLGGKYQLTPTEAMVAKLPVISGDTETGTIMSYGFDPYISEWSPFHGALFAVIESIAKVVAIGGDYKKIYLSFQEYFEKLGDEKERWGKPFSALLGALKVQMEFNIAAIGGKDSMSGSFNHIDVPPTLISFAVGTVDVNNVISQEFKNTNSKVVIFNAPRDKYEIPDFQILRKNYEKIHYLINNNKVASAYTVKSGGIIEAVSKMSFGNKIGIKFNEEMANIEKLISKDYGAIILELKDDEDLFSLLDGTNYKLLGHTIKEKAIYIKDEVIDLDKIIDYWELPLENIFNTKVPKSNKEIYDLCYDKGIKKISIMKNNKPEVFIPVFPGTNCEYDVSKRFQDAGGKTNLLVFKNNTLMDIKESIDAMAYAINKCNILMLPGGFSAGDEPDGSGKFIATVFRNEKLKEAVMELIKNRDGLILGICNGFQALIKLGLIPYGEITELSCKSPTLTYNKIGRHVSCMTNTKVVSNLSPWFSNVSLGDTFTIPVSHGEGRFIAKDNVMENLIKNGQIATQYVDFNKNASYDIKFNPNGSYYAVEGVTSPDGRILGKMAHSERIGNNICVNVPGTMDQKIFESGIKYFK